MESIINPTIKTKMPILNQGDPEEKRKEIRDYFHKTFSLDEEIYKCLSDESAFYKKGNSLRHPFIFYFGHTAVFFVNKLFVSKLIPKRVNPKLESTLAIGVDEMSWDDLNNKNYHWPSVSEVQAYRDDVRKLVDDFIQKTPLILPISWEDPFWIILMGIEHQRIHIETSSVLIRELPLQFVQSNPIFSICPHSGEAPRNMLLPVHGSEVIIGKSRDSAVYGWDNEYGELKVSVTDFKCSQFLVSNGEFLEFINDRGYEVDSYWTEEGLGWRNYKNVKHPHFWVKTDNSFCYRTLNQEIPMPWNWPVDVNYLEAKAFCNWKSKKLGRQIRLLTEAEWLLLRKQIPEHQPTWEKAPGNINLEYWASSCPVDYFKTAEGFYDVIGNAWQWTETPIDALPGFQVHPAYDDFSVPTFDTKHNLIKGGCFISTGNYAIKDSRYAFRRHFFQHSSFRYVESEKAVITIDNPYETDELISQYIEFHYGDTYFKTPNFPKHVAQEALRYTDGIEKSKALDLGCAVGRSSFELAREFKHVDGVDFSARFIQIGVNLQEMNVQRYAIRQEGDLFDYKEISLGDFQLQDVSQRCHFLQGDACNLHPKFTGYDLILACNLIDRLYSPQKFLSIVHERLNQNGILILTSPYTWLEEYTPKEEWIGAKKKMGENQTTLEALAEVLGKHFKLVETKDVPFIIRETKRKFQYSLSQMSVWRKNL